MYQGQGHDEIGVGEYSVDWFGVGQSTEETRVQMQAIVHRAPLVQLDLKDPEAVLQLKTAMGFAPFMLPLVFGDNAELDFDEAFFRDPLWGPIATKFARLWIERFRDTFPGIPNPDSMFVSPHLYPSPVGVLMVLSVLGYKQPGVTTDFSKLGKLTSFFDATEGDPTKGSVLAPHFSREDQEGGTTQVKASTIAAVGLGLLGLTALLVLGGQKRRR